MSCPVAIFYSYSIPIKCEPQMNTSKCIHYRTPKIQESEELRVSVIDFVLYKQIPYISSTFSFPFSLVHFVNISYSYSIIQLSDQEDFIVWMRTAAFPSFRKLYGRIEEDLEEDDIIVVKVMNNYNTYSFGGTKMLVLSTSSWLGGRNSFLGVAYIFVGSSSILIALIFLLLHVKNPR